VWVYVCVREIFQYFFGCISAIVEFESFLNTPSSSSVYVSIKKIKILMFMLTYDCVFILVYMHFMSMTCQNGRGL
jgi:hypothetical protein